MIKHAAIPIVMTFALVVPAFGQQSTPITEQQKQAVQTTIDDYIKAHGQKDAKGLAALFTDDGMLVGTYVPGAVMGRQAVEKYFGDVIQQGRLGSDIAIKADWGTFTSLGNNLILIAGSWAETVPMPPVAHTDTGQPTALSGSSEPSLQVSVKPGDREHGSWTVVDEMQGGKVLIRSLNYNVGLTNPER